MNILARGKAAISHIAPRIGAELLIVALLLVVQAFVGASLRATESDTLILPLDDAYIHFQYARALAEGHPFRYNADQPPTSGATSLLYPPLLAVGYRLGFTGEALSWWALMLGVLAWYGSARLILRLVEATNAPYAKWFGLATALLFILHGSLAWAFLSGMETGLFIYAMLLTLWHVRGEHVRAALLAGTFTALIRPEGAVIGIGAALYVLAGQRRAELWRTLPYYALLAAGILAQPLLNLALTGSPSGSGMQAKSYLYNVPADFNALLSDVLNTAARLWVELFTDANLYLTLPFALLALPLMVYAVWTAFQRQRHISQLIGVWLLGLTAITALVETAFWQFKRYQQPLIALLIVLFGYTAVGIQHLPQRRPVWFTAGSLICFIAALLLNLNTWVRLYAENAREVAFSQMALARAVATLPPEAIVGVHDIGVVRYVGNRTTYDVVGLTTPKAAAAWRHGAGAVFEAMYASPWRPDYFAIYPDARGLTYFEQSGVFGERLDSFPSTYPLINAASATESGQFLYRADWTYAAYAALPHQPSTLAALANFILIDNLNVADLASEAAHNYAWWQSVQRFGFPTELYTLDYVACAPPNAVNTGCRVSDGGRLLTGGERFTVQVATERDLLWVMRVHAQYAVSLRLYADDQPLGVRVVPEIQGRWLEISTLVPRALISRPSLTLRVEVEGVQDSGFYMPYYHWFYQGDYQAEAEGDSLATFAESVALREAKTTYDGEARALRLDLAWSLLAESPFDAVVFMHIYDEAGVLIEAAQRDQRMGDGTLPPANWLPRRLYRERHTLQLPPDLPSGNYRVAVGLYDPRSLTRYAAHGEAADADQRVFIGTFSVR